MKKSWIARENLRLVVLALPFIFLFAFWNQLPEPTSWREALWIPAGNQIGKFHLMVLALLNPALYGGFQLLHLFVLKRQPEHSASWQILQLVSHQLLAFTFFLTALRALGFKLASYLVLQYGIITLLLVLGSFLGNLPRNTTFGFRLSWILKSDAIWHKTHTFAGQVWVYSSSFMLFYTRWQSQNWMFPLYVSLLVLLPVVYSYLISRQHSKAST